MEDWQTAIIEMRADMRRLVASQDRLTYALLLAVLVLAGADKILGAF